jgi:hypothetical protein
MSAAARPKRWGVSRQAKGREFSLPGFPGSNFAPYLTGRAFKGTWGNLWRQKEREMNSYEWIASDGWHIGYNH